MAMLAQSLAVARLNAMGLVSRPGSALVVVLGVACVVGVMLSVLSVTAGLSRASRSGVDPRNAIVLTTEAFAEDGSSVSQDACSTIVQAPGIAHGPDGKAVADCEVLQALPLEGFAGGMLYVRGVGERAWSLYPDFKIVSGHRFRPGIHELVVGAGALAVFNLKVGDRIVMPDGEWPIVGVFSSGGGALESQLLADAATLSASTRASGFNSVVVRLETPAAFAAFAHWIGANPALAVSAERQVQFYLRSVNPFMTFFTSLGFFIATVLAVGALFGSLNVMFGRVRARTREIVTLRVLGFGALPIAVSVLSEAMLLSLAGAAVGVASAWMLFSGRHGIVVHTAYQQSFTAHLVLVGFAWAVTIGLVGALLPTIRAVRLPIAAGVRDTATI
ncbi:MAG: ABC transporter permease [Proteobacteria bacterium]|nr:ABC transporter permease [Pseudomonadota bacterium]